VTFTLQPQNEKSFLVYVHARTLVGNTVDMTFVSSPR